MEAFLEEIVFEPESVTGVSSNGESDIYQIFDKCSNLYKAENISEEEFEFILQEKLQLVEKGNYLRKQTLNLLVDKFILKTVPESLQHDINNSFNDIIAVNGVAHSKTLKLMIRYKEVSIKIKNVLEYIRHCINFARLANLVNDEVEVVIQQIESQMRGIYKRDEQGKKLLNSIQHNNICLEEEDNNILDELIADLNKLEAVFTRILTLS